MDNFNQNEYYQNSMSDFDSSTKIADVTRKTYAYMFFALIVSGLFAVVTFTTGNIEEMVRNNTFMMLIVVELACVIITPILIAKEKIGIAAVLGTLYCILNGVNLSVIFIVYDMQSIISVFFITAGLFGIMTLYAMVTKRDLTSMGSYLMMALIGIILVTFVNVIFIKSEGLDLLLAYAGVFLFLGITVYDTQRIKKMAQYGQHSENAIAMICALNLYLDFINIFLKLLRIFGKKN